MDMLVSYQNKNSLQRQKVDKKTDKKSSNNKRTKQENPHVDSFLKGLYVSKGNKFI